MFAFLCPILVVAKCGTFLGIDCFSSVSADIVLFSVYSNRLGLPFEDSSIAWAARYISGQIRRRIVITLAAGATSLFRSAPPSLAHLQTAMPSRDSHDVSINHPDSLAWPRHRSALMQSPFYLASLWQQERLAEMSPPLKSMIITCRD